MEDHRWTTNDDPRLTHRQKIGSGGFGDVHEVLFILETEADFRWLIRTMTAQ
jgi:hypothetical protein